MENDVIAMTRALGAALQEHPAYKKFREINAQCDADKDLQEQIGQFNLIRMNLDAEVQKQNRSLERVQQLQTNLQTKYNEVMEKPSMIAYNEARGELDGLLQRITGILSNCAQGEDPATTEPCTHDCSTCGGCH